MIFLNSASSAAALVFYLPGVCTHTDTKGKQRKDRVRNVFKKLEKTPYLMNTLCLKGRLVPGAQRPSSSQMVAPENTRFYAYTKNILSISIHDSLEESLGLCKLLVHFITIYIVKKKIGEIGKQWLQYVET